MRRALVILLTALGVAAGSAQATLIGDIAGETMVLGDDLVSSNFVPADASVLLDGDAFNTRYDWNWNTAEPKPNELSATFTSIPAANVTEVVLTFRVANLNGTVPDVALYRDDAHTDLVANVPGNLNAGNGLHPRSMPGLDEDLSTLFFTFTRAAGSPNGARNTFLFGEMDITGTVIPEPGVFSLLLSGLVLLLARKKHRG